MLASWATEEMQTAKLKDPERATNQGSDLGERSWRPIPVEACGGKNEIDAAYRFFDNEKATDPRADARTDREVVLLITSRDPNNRWKVPVLWIVKPPANCVDAFAIAQDPFSVQALPSRMRGKWLIGSFEHLPTGHYSRQDESITLSHERDLRCRNRQSRTRNHPLQRFQNLREPNDEWTLGTGGHSVLRLLPGRVS